MSLRAFHIVFITASGLLAAFCAAWAVSQYRADPSAVYLAGAVVSVACVGGAGGLRHDVPAQDEEPVMMPRRPVVGGQWSGERCSRR